MVIPINYNIEKATSPPSRLSAVLAAAISFFRGLPLFVSGRPKTPLRVLCLMAFDTVHVLRNSQRMSSHTMRNLATLLDLGACANDFFDKNNFSRQEYRVTRRLLEKSESSAMVNEYIRRLRNLENRRPLPGGDDQQHRQAQTYRESIIRLSLGKIATTALGNLTIEDGIQATFHDEDLETLFRIVMLCQIIDDVIDFKKDKEDGLPTFLTAHASPSQALSLTSKAAKQYADQRGLSSSPHVFPFSVALWGVSIISQVAIIYGYLRLRSFALRSWFKNLLKNRKSKGGKYK